MAPAQVFFRGEEQVDHKFDHLARREVLPGFLVGLLRADPDQFFEDVAHLHIVDPLRGEVDPFKGFDDLKEQILPRHDRNLLIELEALHDLPHVGGEGVHVGVKVGRELVGVVEQAREVEPREVVERPAGHLTEQAVDDGIRLVLHPIVFHQHGGVCRRQDGIEAAKDREGEDDLAVFVPFIGSAQEVADGPDEAGDLGVGFGGHAGGKWDRMRSLR